MPQPPCPIPQPRSLTNTLCAKSTDIARTPTACPTSPSSAKQFITGAKAQHHRCNKLHTANPLQPQCPVSFASSLARACRIARHFVKNSSHLTQRAKHFCVLIREFFFLFPTLTQRSRTHSEIAKQQGMSAAPNAPNVGSHPHRRK